jgi:hypothetical protein
MTKINRIEKIRSDRKTHGWLSSIGIASDAIHMIKKGEEPSENVLRSIAKCENVSWFWFSEGQGSPYLVENCETDEECAEHLANHFNDEAWTAYHVTAGDRFAFVLTMPGTFQRARSGWVDYTIVEAFTGAGSRSLAEAAMNAAVFKTIEIKASEMDQLEAGELGTYALLGDSKTAGLLSGAKLVNMKDRLQDLVMIKPEDLSQIKPDQQLLLNDFEALSYENQQIIKKLIKNLG